jgi:hypothetical protein
MVDLARSAWAFDHKMGFIFHSCGSHRATARAGSASKGHCGVINSISANE